MPRVVAHLYKGTEGIYGIPVGVVATYVFHFVLFGIMAQLTGLGQLFVNLIYSPIMNVELGGELIYGQRKTFAGDTGTLSRFDLMGRYSF